MQEFFIDKKETKVTKQVKDYYKENKLGRYKNELQFLDETLQTEEQAREFLSNTEGDVVVKVYDWSKFTENKLKKKNALEAKIRDLQAKLDEEIAKLNSKAKINFMAKIDLPENE